MKLKITLKDLQESGDESEREPRCYHKDNAGKNKYLWLGAGIRKLFSDTKLRVYHVLAIEYPIYTVFMFLFI